MKPESIDIDILKDMFLRQTRSQDTGDNKKDGSRKWRLKVIGLDTNILVRYLISDESDQAAIATEFIENTCHGDFKGYISHTVLCELAWVLTGIYGYTQEQVVKELDRILRLEQLCVEDPLAVRRALRDYRKKGMNFTDHLIAHANQRRGCEYTATLDTNASEVSSMILLR